MKKHNLKLKTKHIRLKNEDRLYNIKIPIIGLTGGIATGKSTVSQMFEDLGASIICADQLVKNIYKLSESFEFINKNYPKAIIENKIHFPTLRKIVFSNPKDQDEVEKFIYSKLPHEFLNALKKNKNPFIIYDVPLLFEKGLDSKIDTIICVYAPRNIQKERLISRDNISSQLADNILNTQWDIEKKKSSSQIIIDNSQSLSKVKKIVESTFSDLFA